MRWCWSPYGSAPDPDCNAAPRQGDHPSGLPPAIVVTPEFDPLRDEGEAYANRLVQAGVDTSLSRYDGMFHGFFSMSAFIDRARDAVDEVTAAVGKALA